MAYIYHERQLGGLCGVHCLNNLLQGPHFGPGDLAEIGVRLDLEEGKLHGDVVQYNVDSSADGGNFSIQVLAVALKRFGVELLPAKHPSARLLMKDPPKAAEAFLCQYKDHWFAVREVGSCWWNLNSTRQRPGLVGAFHLAAWLGQLSTEGYSIFLVRGADLPAVAPDADQTEETYHEVAGLMELAKSGGDNPLAGGDSNSGQVEIPPDLLMEAQLYDSATAVGFRSELAPPSLVGAAGIVGRRRHRNSPSARVHEFQGASHMAASTGGGGHREKACAMLREMGFRGPEIHAALELASGSVERASELLVQAKGRQGDGFGDAHFAEMLQQAVQDLDASGGISEAILRLVMILSTREEELHRETQTVNTEVLTEYLISVLARRGQAWRPEDVRAANVAVDLLAARSKVGSSDALGEVVSL